MRRVFDGSTYKKAPLKLTQRSEQTMSHIISPCSCRLSMLQ